MPETTTPAATPAPVGPSSPAPASSPAIVPVTDPAIARLEARFAEIEERSRRDVTLPAGMRPGPAEDPRLRRGRWATLVIRSLAGERVDTAELRSLLPAPLHTRETPPPGIADVTTSDNLGVVPEQFRSEMIGEINRSRPFLESTRNVPAGSSGLTFNFPKLVTRPLTGVQAAEKDQLASRATSITTVPFEAITVGGVGDLSLQLLRRSSPEFLALWLDLLAESYAINADDLALDALLAESAVNEGGTFDPEAPTFGGAFTQAAGVARSMLPDRAWLSTAALAAFIDAKEPTGGGGRPLYPGLATIEGVTAGAGGPIPIRLRPVWVPALDDESVDIIVGPSRGFAWAEDGTYTLSADVPSKGGRDVGMLGMLWFMPLYPAAFTSYTLPAAG